MIVDEFDKEPHLLYLAGTNQSLCPRRVLESRARWAREYEKNPTEGLHHAWARLWEVQHRLASFLDTDARNLFLRPNATSVLNTLLLGIPLPPGAEMLVGELEYGAVVNICRLRVAREGLRLRSLQMPGNAVALARAGADELTAHVVSQLGPETKLLVLSEALGATGLVLPIAAIARETRRRGIALVVDGTHALGALPTRLVAESDVDYYGCGFYKWMLGPKGTAFGWVAPRHQERLQATQGGWTTFESFEPMHGFGGGHRFQETFLMHGCHDYTPFLALEAMLAFWCDHGREALHARRLALQRTLREAMHAHAPDWRLLHGPPGSPHAPMLVYRLPPRLQPHGKGLVSRLHAEHRLQATSVHLRGAWHLVLGPHVYNDDPELEAAARILATL